MSEHVLCHKTLLQLTKGRLWGVASPRPPLGCRSLTAFIVASAFGPSHRALPPTSPVIDCLHLLGPGVYPVRVELLAGIARHHVSVKGWAHPAS